jgi:hypothetical protein
LNEEAKFAIIWLHIQNLPFKEMFLFSLHLLDPILRHKIQVENVGLKNTNTKIVGGNIL